MIFAFGIRTTTSGYLLECSYWVLESVEYLFFSAGSGYWVGNTKIHLNKNLFYMCQGYLSFNVFLHGMIFVFGIRTTTSGLGARRFSSYWVVANSIRTTSSGCLTTEIRFRP